MKTEFGFKQVPPLRVFALLAGALALGGCSAYGSWQPVAGPSTRQVVAAPANAANLGIQLVDVTEAVAQRVLASQRKASFAESFPPGPAAGSVIGPGDVIEISVWEAPPALLFGGATADPRGGAATTRVTTFPEQMVNTSGEVNVPFAGKIRAAGRNAAAIEADIVQRLQRKANQPQVLVRLTRNNTSNVTVVGEIVNSLRMPLTDRRERLLDALAAAGGVRQPVNKMTLQLTRGDQVQSMPLDVIIRDPRQNVLLQPGDVLTSLFQSQSFTVLGATGKNEEVNFEASGITLAQALGRVGGLQDLRADVRGVFLFRFENAAALDNGAKALRTTPDGKVPVIYRIDLSDPATFFIAQNFPLQSKDILYVSNAPAAELQKFLNIVGAVVGPAVAIQAARQL
ncbi:MAG: polysaccharide biosynthesis/export family protein [Pseudomonadota bacterium]